MHLLILTEGLGTKMPSQTLSGLFIENRGDPIEWEGRSVYQMWSKDWNQELQKLVIRRISSDSTFTQGLRVKLDRGEMLVNGQILKDATLWSDTSPDLVRIDIVKTPKVIKIWNTWLYDGQTWAWTGNAGMLIQEQGCRVLLRCSDGVGEVDFGNLVIELDYCQ